MFSIVFPFEKLGEVKRRAKHTSGKKSSCINKLSGLEYRQMGGSSQ